MKSLLWFAVAAVFCWTAYAAEQSPDGVWTAELRGGGAEISLFRHCLSADHGRPGMHHVVEIEAPVSRFAGLSDGDAASPAANVSFELREPAGTIAFEGRMAERTGAGHYRFTPDPGFVREMDSLGYRGFTEDQFLIFAAREFHPQTIRDLRAMGYEPTQEQIEEIALFGITAGVLHEFAGLGYRHLTLQEAVNFRLGRVDAAWIRDMRDLGYGDLSASQAANLAILGVMPATIRELRALGYARLTAEELEQMRAMRITPDYIRTLAAKGYTNIPVGKLMQLRALGADRILFK